MSSFIATADGPKGPAALAQPALVIVDDRDKLLVAVTKTGEVHGDRRTTLSYLLNLAEPRRSHRDNLLCIALLRAAILAEELGGARHGNAVPSFGRFSGGEPGAPSGPAFGVYRNIVPPQHYALDRAAAHRWARDAAAADPFSNFTVVQAHSVLRGPPAQPEIEE